MARIRKRTAIVAVGVALALTAAACSSSKKAGGGTASASGAGASGAVSTKKGGTIYELTKRDVDQWDPQRLYIGSQLTFASRLFYRTLTQLAPDNKVVPDLATDTGKATNGNKTWTFTLRDGVKWQDGSPITCQDLKYGASRTFATDVITSGPNYAIQFFNIPTNPDGSSVYSGPYTKKNQAAYDKAVTCSGNTITYQLKKPVADFNYAVSGALAEFAPFKASQDKGAQSRYQVFASGPYMLQGTWQHLKGGTFVRNPMYDPKTDDTSIRRALPDKVVWEEGIAVETVFDRLLADAGPDKFAITDRTAPPAYQPRVATQKSRIGNPETPFVDYLAPNFKRLTNPLVRQALAVAADKTGWITAYGGPAVMKPANSIILPSVQGYKDFGNVFNAPESGDPAKAKSLLQQAGVQIPYPLHFTYNGGTPTTDAQASSMKAALDKAGFSVTLEGISENYYSTIQNPHNSAKYDLMWAGWGADWPTASTVVPSLFDSRVNLSAESTEQDYGYYDSKTTNAGIDAAYNTLDASARNAKWGDLSESLAKDVAYIPLVIEKFLRLHGSGVTNYTEDPASNGYPDMGQLGTTS